MDMVKKKKTHLQTTDRQQEKKKIIQFKCHTAAEQLLEILYLYHTLKVC